MKIWFFREVCAESEDNGSNLKAFWGLVRKNLLQFDLQNQRFFRIQEKFGKKLNMPEMVRNLDFIFWTLNKELEWPDLAQERDVDLQ